MSQRKWKRLTLYNSSRGLTKRERGKQNKMEQQQQIQQLQKELQTRNMEMQQMAATIKHLDDRQKSTEHKEKLLKEVRYMSNFTGRGDVTINSFISNVEYYLNSINDEGMRKAAVRIIYFEKIQGEAKDSIINIREVDNWQSIKEGLKTRYRPDTEPSEIYKRMYNIRVNTVSDLANEIQNLKYKSDELKRYYGNDLYIDLGNVDSLLGNTVKDMVQGILLDKIYQEREIDKIIQIMRQRKFEDFCIKKEFRKDYNNTWNKNFNNSKAQQAYFKNDYRHSNNFNKNSMNNDNNNHYNKNVNNFKPQYQDSGHNRRSFNQNGSGNFRAQNTESGNYRNFNGNIANFGRNNVESGNYRAGSNQYRQHNPFRQNSGQYRQYQTEPMEVDNVQYHKRNRYRNLNNDSGQNCQNQDNNSNNQYSANTENNEESNNIFFHN